MIAETLIIHGGDLIEWCEKSGFVAQPPRRIAPERLTIVFSQAPRGLRIFHKRYGTLLWHPKSAGPSKVVAGKAAEEDLIAGASATYALEGRVSDPSGRYLPRTFSLTLGNAAEHPISLYQAPLGAPFSQAGGLYGQLGFDDGTPAPWALLALTVTPSLGPSLQFLAQADHQGEFRLPLDRLPALTKDAPAPTYAAELTVKASLTANPDQPRDPDQLAPVKVAKGKGGNGKSLFANALDFAVAPGTLAKLVSPKHPLIVLKST